MALISDLISAIAEVEGVPEATVALAARYAREAGYLSQGARGRNAARATVADCANLLIAVNASGCVVKDAPMAIDEFRKLEFVLAHGGFIEKHRAREYAPVEADALKFLDNRDATFGEILESIIVGFVSRDLEVFMLEEASKFVNIDAARARQGNNEAAVKSDVQDGARLFIRQEFVRFDVSFRRPKPFAEVVVSRSNAGAQETLCCAQFSIGRPMDIKGDRRDVASIGCATFLKVAEVMRE